MTYGEIALWIELKGKKLYGYDFHRQKPIDNYIVDFYCPELKLVIEIDGISHNNKLKLDKARQNELERLGLRVIRFYESDVLSNLSGVMICLKKWIRTHPLIPLS